MVSSRSSSWIIWIFSFFDDLDGSIKLHSNILLLFHIIKSLNSQIALWCFCLTCFFMSKSTNRKKNIEQSTHPPSVQRSWPGSGLDFGGSFGPAIDGLKPKTSIMSVSTCIWKWIIPYYFYIYAFLQWKANLWESSSHLNLCHVIMKQCVWTWNIYANLADEIHMHSASVAQKVSVWSHFDVNPTIHKLFRVMVNPFQALKCSN